MMLYLSSISSYGYENEVENENKNKNKSLLPTANTATTVAGATAVVCRPPCRLFPLPSCVTLTIICHPHPPFSSSSSSLPLSLSVAFILVGAAAALVCLWFSTGLPQLFMQRLLLFVLPSLVQCLPSFICGP